MATGTAMAIVGGASALVGTASSISSANAGKRRQREAQKDIDSYERQELKNAYEGMTVPMEAFQMREEAIQRSSATALDMASQAGARGVVGAVPQIMAQTNLAEQQLSADIEGTTFKIRQMIAQDEARIQGMRESREQQDLSGLGAEVQAGRQQYYGGINNAIGSIGAGASSVAGAFGKTPTLNDATKPPTGLPLGTPAPIMGGSGNDIYNQFNNIA